MNAIRSKNLFRIAALAVAVMLGGCLNENPTGPDSGVTDAPVLPSAERLAFEFDFFQEPSPLERASKDNFYNAYLRAIVTATVTHVVLTPPIYAFSLALHTPPSPQDDGSYVWVYTYVDGADEVQVRLRGLPRGDSVEWELRISNNHSVPTLDNVVWFEGVTRDDGEQGWFDFRDVWEDANPIDGRMEWGKDSDGNYLRFTDLEENVDDTLEFREVGTRKSFTWTDASDPTQSWFVKWDESDGTGSLRAPDYNSGEEACWDQHQNDVDCAPVS